MVFHNPANTAVADLNPAFSANALALIVDAEGVDQPGQFPGGSSGISLGHGYDLSAETREELIRDWSPFLTAGELGSLVAVCGKSGSAAAAVAPALRNIRVSKEASDHVFITASLPKYVQLTRLVYPTAFSLPLDACGALVSLIYNRGSRVADMHPGDRLEMRCIRSILADGVQQGDLALIAKQLRAMKRLWEGKGLAGLITRRETEACLVEQAG